MQPNFGRNNEIVYMSKEKLLFGEFASSLFLVNFGYLYQ